MNACEFLTLESIAPLRHLSERAVKHDKHIPQQHRRSCGCFCLQDGYRQHLTFVVAAAAAAAAGTAAPPFKPAPHTEQSS
jgi:hypothetical protein